MGALEVKYSSSWRTITAPEVKYSGSWRAVKTIEAKIGGAWQEVFSSGPTVSAAADGDSNIRFNNTCYAGIQFVSSGDEREYTSTGGTSSVGSWLDSGSGSEVWVERVVTAGSWNSIDPGAGRHQLSTTRSFRVIRSSAGVQSVTGYFKFWDAASGGSLLQQTASATYSAEYTI